MEAPDGMWPSVEKGAPNVMVEGSEMCPRFLDLTSDDDERRPEEIEGGSKSGQRIRSFGGVAKAPDGRAPGRERKSGLGLGESER